MGDLVSRQWTLGGGAPEVRSNELYPRQWTLSGNGSEQRLHRKPDSFEGSGAHAVTEAERLSASAETARAALGEPAQAKAVKSDRVTLPNDPDAKLIVRQSTGGALLRGMLRLIPFVGVVPAMTDMLDMYGKVGARNASRAEQAGTVLKLGGSLACVVTSAYLAVGAAPVTLPLIAFALAGAGIALGADMFLSNKSASGQW